MRDFRKNTAGNVAVMSAMLLPVVLGFAAFAVDEGALSLERRDMQGAADLAAIVAAANIKKAEKAAYLTLLDNGFAVGEPSPGSKKTAAKGESNVSVETGTYAASVDVPVDERFSPGAKTPDAVRVTFRKKGTLYFAGMFIDPPEIEVSSTAKSQAEAAFAIGSRLLKLEGGVLNSALNGLLGTDVTLSVMDYEALLDADVNVLKFFDALGTDLNIKGGTYNDVLAANASIGDIADAMASVTSPGSTASKALARIALSSNKNNDVEIPLSHLIDLGSLGNMALGQGTSGFDARANAMNMLAATGAIANGSNQVSLNIGATVPGLASVTADLAVGEPMQHLPWFAVGNRGVTVRTAQTRLRVVANVGGTGLLKGLSVRLPLYLELAYGEATLSDVSCASGDPLKGSATVDARPGIADFHVADVDPDKMRLFESAPKLESARILSTSVLNVSGNAHIEVGNTTAQPLKFSQSDVDEGTIRTVSTKNYLDSLVGSLLGDLSLQVKTAGLSLGTPAAIQGALADTLSNAAKPIDSTIYNLLAIMGVGLGQADVRVTAVRCGQAVLIQ